MRLATIVHLLVILGVVASGCDKALAPSSVSAAPAEPAAAAPGASPEATTAKLTSGTKFRLQRIAIPSNSKLRDIAWDDHSPPDLRITISKDGELIGKTSESKEGWDVEFSKTKPDNQFVIDGDETTTYSITLYDHDSPDPDDLMLTVSGIKAEQFKAPIVEALGLNDPRDRCVTFFFVPVE